MLPLVCQVLVRRAVRLARFAVCMALAPALMPTVVQAWGRTGHEIIAAIARDELTEAERRQAAEFLAAAQLPDLVRVGPWADEYRIRHPQTAPWHFVDIPLAASGYREDRDCHDNGKGHYVVQLTCVVTKIGELRQQLGDKSLSAYARGIAFAFLVHLVGDIHQPLHASNNDDHGGNDVPVTFFGEAQIVYSSRTYSLVLHAVWDTSIIERLYGVKPDIDATAVQLRSTITATQRQDWCVTEIADWANETHAVAASMVYPQLPNGTPKALAQEYYDKATPVVNLQLQRAGVRLACTIRAALK